MLLACLQGKQNHQVAHKMETLIPIREQTPSAFCTERDGGLVQRANM
jgi:hypothetical protein